MFTLDQVVPWGRSFDEYRRMFALTDADLRSRILGCGDGPASFNSEATRGGASVVSFDPLYRHDARHIRERIAATCDQVLEQTRQNAAGFVWDTIASVEQLGTVRMAAMNAFLDDYDAGRQQGRYVEAELPSLPFPDRSFDLAVCSHLLFLYTAQLTEAFHQAAVIELCRVAREVRIFPLLALDGRPSPYVDLVADSSRRRGAEVAIELVPYEFRRGGNQMLRIRSNG
jgi:SAM-dependent methyltransferase